MLAARLFNRIPIPEIEDGLVRIGVKAGDRLMPLISLRSLGYVPGGVGGLVEAIHRVVGPEGSVMMPAFPVLGPLPDMPSEGIFDETETPSAAGLLSETFRRSDGALRSLHPVGSMSARGPLARAWLEGHERSLTPFGIDTPIHRFVASGGRLLLCGAHAGPILPYLQEKAGYPNLYLAGRREVIVRPRSRGPIRVGTRQFQGRWTQVVILQGERAETRDYVLMRDYALVFPPGRDRVLVKGGLLRQNLGRLVGRLERLRQREVLTVGSLGKTPAVLIEAQPFCEQVGADLAWEIARFKDDYDPQRLENLPLVG